MTGLVARRIGLALITLWLFASLIFVVCGALPGDAAESILGQDATPETLAALRASLGLDEPAVTRYWAWLTGMVRGDFGFSRANGLPVTEMILSRLPGLLLLAGLSAALAIPVSLFLGIASAMRPGSVFDRRVTVLSILALSTPSFLIATLVVLLLSVWIRAFPALADVSRTTGAPDVLHVMTLPVVALSLSVIGRMVRMIRAILLTSLRERFVEMAILKGASRLRATVLHALPNVAVPIVSASALSLDAPISGVVFVEVVFPYPGLTKLMVDSVAVRDLPLMQAFTLVFCTGYLVRVLIADVISILANPRLRSR